MNPLSFEVLRFRGAPASPDVALLELEGRLAADPPLELERARMVLEAGGSTLELDPVGPAAARATPDGTSWRATYVVPLSALEVESAALDVGRGLLLELPAPDLEEGDGSDAARHVRLAREANALRRRLDELAEERAGLERELDGERDEHLRAQAALTAARTRLSALERTTHELESERGHLGTEIAELRTALSAARRRRAAAPDEEPAGGEPAAEPEPTAEVTRPEPTAPPEDDPAEPLTVRRSAAARPPVAARVGAEPVRRDPDETVRVLGTARRRPRHTFDDEAETARLPPGAAEIGARHIEPVGHRRSGARMAIMVAVLVVLIAVAVLLVTHPR